MRRHYFSSASWKCHAPSLPSMMALPGQAMLRRMCSEDQASHNPVQQQRRSRSSSTSIIAKHHPAPLSTSTAGTVQSLISTFLQSQQQKNGHDKFHDPVTSSPPSSVVQKEHQSTELERSVLRELGKGWKHVEWTHFQKLWKKHRKEFLLHDQNQQKTPPAFQTPTFQLTDATTFLAQWQPDTRVISFSRSFVFASPWTDVLEVLKHEMVHQYVSEVMYKLMKKEKSKQQKHSDGADHPRMSTRETAHGPIFKSICQQLGIDERARVPLPTSSSFSSSRDERQTARRSNTIDRNEEEQTNNKMKKEKRKKTTQKTTSLPHQGPSKYDFTYLTSSSEEQEELFPSHQLLLLKRVSKLFALATSSNVHEAEAAMKAAQKLVWQYNLGLLVKQEEEGGKTGSEDETTQKMSKIRRRGSQSESPDDDDEEVRPRRHSDSNNYIFDFRQITTPKKKLTSVDRLLAQILSNFFFVETIWVRVYQAWSQSYGATLEVCGTRYNIDMAEYVIHFLNSAGERLWHQEHQDELARGDAKRGEKNVEVSASYPLKRYLNKQAFLTGVMRGFFQKLSIQREELIHQETKGNGPSITDNKVECHYQQEKSSSLSISQKSQLTSLSIFPKRNINSKKEEDPFYQSKLHLKQKAYLRKRYPKIRWTRDRGEGLARKKRQHYFSRGVREGRKIVLHKPVSNGHCSGRIGLFLSV